MVWFNAKNNLPPEEVKEIYENKNIFKRFKTYITYITLLGTSNMLNIYF